MNELQLIKIDVNQNNEQVVSARELYCELDSIEDFQDFFIKVSEYRVAFKLGNLSKLRNILAAFVFKFDSDAITYLQDSIDAEMVLACKRCEPRESRESVYKNRIISGFAELFPDYDLVGSEVLVDGIGRIDILAFDRKSKRPVIIELKVGNSSPNQQLIAYASRYREPVLIGITEDAFPENRREKGIIYLTYSELFK